MCGIAGILNLSMEGTVLEDSVTKMIDIIHHRGPDGHAVKIDGCIGMGHARLSIIDIEGGTQPICNEAKDIWVVFNGEIFNYIELTKKLKRTGHVFSTNSDTEVIVHLYEEYGLNFVDHLNGQFSIAIWDSIKKRLVLVRDRPGICPLFYSVINNKLYFSSEIKSILTGFESSPSLNESALDELMTFWSPVGSNTVFKDIKSVEPGCLLVIENGNIDSKCYWQWMYPENGQYIDRNESEVVEELKDLLIDSVKIRLRSDVPVGAYLSGGLDSSSLVSMIHRHSNVPMRTFSISFEDKGLDESSYQQQMINHVKAEHSQIVCTQNDIAEQFYNTIWHCESPILRTAPVPMGILSSLVKNQGFKVVLTGEGSDEVLGGYDIFKESKIRQFWAKNPSSNFRSYLLKRLYPYLNMGQERSGSYLQNFFGVSIDTPDDPFFSHLPRWQTTAKCKDFFSSDMKSKLNENVYERIEQILPDDFDKWRSFCKAQFIEAKSLMAGYLLSSQGDRMLMMNSIEGRFPFLDHRVIELANKLEPKLKMKVLNEKYILKKAMTGYVPGEIINRHKQPYRSPDIPSFFNGEIHDYVKELMSPGCIDDYGYFDGKKVDLLYKKAKKGRAIGYKDNMAFVGILSTQLWHHHFIKEFDHNFR